MSRSYALIGVLLFFVYTMSFMLVTTRHALRLALDTLRFDGETEPFLPGVFCDEKMESGHSILKKDKATLLRVCSTLLDLLVEW